MPCYSPVLDYFVYLDKICRGYYSLSHLLLSMKQNKELFTVSQRVYAGKFLLCKNIVTISLQSRYLMRDSKVSY